MSRKLVASIICISAVFVSFFSFEHETIASEKAQRLCLVNSPAELVAGYGLGTTFPVPRNRLRFFKFGLPGQPLISTDRLALQFSRFFSLFPC